MTMDYEIKLPGEAGYAEYYHALLRSRCRTLSRHGWRFRKITRFTGGFCYEGCGEQGRKILTGWYATEQQALLAAILQAEGWAK